MTGLEAKKIIEDKIAYAKNLVTDQKFQMLSDIRQSLSKQSGDIIWSFERSWGNYAVEVLSKKKKRIESRAQSIYGDCSFNSDRRKEKEQFIKENMLLFVDGEAVSDEDIEILNGLSDLSSRSFSKRDADSDRFDAFKAQAEGYISFATSVKNARDDLRLCEQILKQRIYHVALEIAPGQIEGYKAKIQTELDELNNRINSGNFKDQSEFASINKKIGELRKQITLLDSYSQKLVGPSPTEKIESKAEHAQEILKILGIVFPEENNPTLSKETVGQAVSTLHGQVSAINENTISAEEKKRQEQENIKRQNLAPHDYNEKAGDLRMASSNASNLITLLKEAAESNDRYAVPLRVQTINTLLNTKNEKIKDLRKQLESVDTTSLLGRFSKKNKEAASAINTDIQKFELEAKALEQERAQKDPNNDYEQRLKEERQRMSENVMFNNTSTVSTSNISNFMDATDTEELRNYVYSRGSSQLLLKHTSISALITRIEGRKRSIDADLDSLERRQTSILDSTANIRTLDTQMSQNQNSLNEKNQRLAYLQGLTPQGIDALNIASEQMELINSLNSAPITPEEEEQARKKIEDDIEEARKQL